MKPTSQDLAYAFSRLLREELSDTQIGEVISRNAEESNPAICHSHDFTDANEVMALAWREVTGGEINPQDDVQCELWDQAWQLAKASEFETDCVTDEERSNGHH